MKKVLILLSSTALIYACGGSSSNKSNQGSTNQATQTESTTPETKSDDYDATRGEGKFTSENITIGATLDTKLAKAGEEIQGVKCSSCHRLTDEKLVGPGWKGVTERRKPEWIMNFITNPEPMIDKDPAVQAQLELCLVRMPNQSLTEDEARNIYEFMRKNDGVQ
jgi:mono/diheme cytochrome c family protein